MAEYIVERLQTTTTGREQIHAPDVAPADEMTLVTDIMVHNTDSSAVTVSLEFGRNAAYFYLYKSVSIPAGDTLNIRDKIVLRGEKVDNIAITTSAANVVNVVLNGIKLPDLGVGLY